ncbi:MAG: hypothetical protein AAF958_18285 [Planctomycetota bacterium]
MSHEAGARFKRDGPHIDAKPPFDRHGCRIEHEGAVLSVQDTTELDFTQHPTEDSGVLNQEYRLGLDDHTQIALTESGLCLGVIDFEHFSFDAETLGQCKENGKQRSIEERRIASMAPGISASLLVGRTDAR